MLMAKQMEVKVIGICMKKTDDDGNCDQGRSQVQVAVINKCCVQNDLNKVW